MTVAASAGALLDFTTLTVKSYTVSCGKGCSSTSYGFSGSHAGSSASSDQITMKGGATYQISQAESSPFNLFQMRFENFSGTPTNANTFQSLMLGNLRINADVGESNIHKAINNNDFLFTKTSYSGSFSTMSSANNSTIILQFRAD